MSKAGRVIVNVSHRDHLLNESILGKFVVLGRGEPYSEVRPYGMIEIPEIVLEPHDRGWGEPSPATEDGRYVVEIKGDIVAKAVLGAFYDALGRYSDGLQRKYGVFIPAGEEPTQAEIDEATKGYLEELHREFTMANAGWGSNRQVRNINDHARLAVKVLGKTVEWAPGVEVVRNIPCPNCSELVPSTMAVHRRMKDGTDCGYVLDEEKAKRIITFPKEDGAKRRKGPDQVEVATG